jgi:hypothetical protein
LEFRCWPDDGAVGVNRFDTSIAVTVSTQPYFRAFSTGGINTNFERVLVDPELESVANGGFNPNSFPNPGAPTFGQDNEFYIGSVDFVVRVSRSYSVWFPVVDPQNGGTFENARFYPPTIEPSQEDQPIGSDIQVAFRGAVNVQSDSDPYEDVLANAGRLDIYGDHYIDNTSSCDLSVNHDRFTKCPPVAPQVNTPISFLDNVDRWFDDPAEVDGSAYYQARLTFTANAETGLTPELSAFAMTWSK